MVGLEVRRRRDVWLLALLGRNNEFDIGPLIKTVKGTERR
jgi:hypothetical protein